MSQMNYDFPQKVYNLFDLGGYCYDFEDGHNDADCLHHILGRVSNSPYNACPLNNRRNHMPEGRQFMGLVDIHDEFVESKYLIAVKEYLDIKGYEPNENDLEFLKEYKHYYEKGKTKIEAENEEQEGSLPIFIAHD